ncbi:NUDIX domain protein [Collimonas arenae]|uniref:NUDIX domain protein n=2 Tax=Collimonas arenae TaxID=279058 RepID=A0A127QLQ5_9BURK|nr:NUDIX domain protein [Collimonas arenae]
MMPVDAVAGESALAPERMNATWLRQRFAQQPEWHPEDLDSQAIQRMQQGRPVTPASVLIPIVMHEAQPTLLFTQRAAHLTDHAGQVSFPGGRMEQSDASPVETALREAEEEIGLVRSQVEVIGTLPEYFTGTGYRVTPVVCLIVPPVSLRADPDEVAEIFEVPLAFLMDGLNHQLRSIDLPDGYRRTFYAMPYERFFIWGATAAMLRNLFHFLRA